MLVGFSGLKSLFILHLFCIFVNVIPKPKQSVLSGLGKRFFFVSAPVLWKSLPWACNYSAKLIGIPPLLAKE